MKVLLTGGSGDMGVILAQQLLERGDEVVILDVAKPHPALAGRAAFTEGSILNRDSVKQAVKDVDCVVHIAAWHGIHEQQGKTAYDFHDLNVTGTFNVFQAAADAGVTKAVLISSTSVKDRFGLYGHTKILNEEMARAYAERHGMDILVLRPRAFVPPWNRTVYDSFVGWANWFARGAVHVYDVCQATVKAIDFLKTNKPPEPAQALQIDGAYDYTENDLENWSESVPERLYGAEAVEKARQAGITIDRKPRIVGSRDAEELIGYKAEYSMRNLLDDFKRHGTKGPPHPLEKPAAAAAKAPRL